MSPVLPRSGSRDQHLVAVTKSTPWPGNEPGRPALLDIDGLDAIRQRDLERAHRQPVITFRIRTRGRPLRPAPTTRCLFMGSVRFDRHIAEFTQVTQSLAEGQRRNSRSRANALAFDRLVIAPACPASSQLNAIEQSIACSAIPVAGVRHVITAVSFRHDFRGDSRAQDRPCDSGVSSPGRRAPSGGPR